MEAVLTFGTKKRYRPRHTYQIESVTPKSLWVRGYQRIYSAKRYIREVIYG
jgi:hypothetical protein